MDVRPRPSTLTLVRSIFAISATLLLLSHYYVREMLLQIQQTTNQIDEGAYYEKRFLPMESTRHHKLSDIPHSMKCPNISTDVAPIPSSSPGEKIQIFYNLFIDNEQSFERVEAMVREQLAYVSPRFHNQNIIINSMGYIKPDNTISGHKITRHWSSGGEELTLHSIWEYCTANPNHDSKVAYLHSKGSFHPKPENDQLRVFLTEGALSKECAKLPDQCDVCSSRMSPLPHPHTGGNMWMARCDYISKLVDPSSPIETWEGGNKTKTRHFRNHDNGCKGWGRFFNEHWIHSHPTVKPCDLYPFKEYVWNYENVPGENFAKELAMVPRFNYNDYIIDGVCSEETLDPEIALKDRIEVYDAIYQKRPHDSW
eukprot:CAMPEP_0195284410 /NCGR_PEP_ID=MMETSP0707-20130614/2618_1 /TAXON_ID=33640 /ORGANISM="Asterionellopsis glacialis, Strain CCMP134" /LENGTH=368 /DNA_ID=CAMNT_0040343743 /DNA_START=47 /DNA_END=1150 /DNA_ORIENTATION=+